MTKSTLKISKYNDLEWRNDKGMLHRGNDKPALIEPDGRKEWWVNGKCHRDNNKPAIIYLDGYKEWWINGKFIRNNL